MFLEGSSLCLETNQEEWLQISSVHKSNGHSKRFQVRCLVSASEQSEAMGAIGGEQDEYISVHETQNKAPPPPSSLRASVQLQGSEKDNHKISCVGQQ